MARRARVLPSAIRSQSGQATAEWTGLVLLVSLLVASLAVLAGPLPGTELARAIGARLQCAVGIDGDCDAVEESRLAAAYGEEVAGLVAEHAPTLRYEQGMLELPIDFRDCREDACSVSSQANSAWRTVAGLPATAFVHVIDCRGAAAATPRCARERAGRLYVQYWLYYPDSQTEPFGDRGYHRDDWESFQVRIGEQAEARASSHHSYNYEGGVSNWPSDAGVDTKSAWGPFTGELHVSAGSHAGHVFDEERGDRHTPAARLRLLPLEGLSASERATEFAVTPPWEKQVFRDPEHEGTG